MSLRDVVEAALESEPPTERDRATGELALTYAQQIDGHQPCEECGCQGCGDLAKLGPALLSCLESLLMSPRARAAAKKAVTSEQPAANPLDQLAARRAGKSGPEDRHTATT